MPNPCLLPICRTHTKNINYLTRMYYISIYKIYRYKYFKEKIKSDYMGTTHTTSLKPTSAAVNLLYPRTFYKGTTGVQQHTTFYFLRPLFCYLIDLLDFTFCCMLYPCLR
jgi:hypothetical protein